MAFNEEPKLHMSFSQRVNLGNYQHAEVSFGVSQLPFDAPEHQIETALETARLTFDRMKVVMRNKIAQVRQEGGFGGEMVEGSTNFERRV